MPSKTLIVISLALLGFSLLTPAQVTTSTAQNSTPPQTMTPVVLELFTSEGCSSCPPADALLKKLDDAGRFGAADIIAIEEHVDYWNHLGWTDPFSSHEWTTRQARYATALGLSGVYTPQLLVNGNRELVGGSGQKAFETIVEAAKMPAAKLGLSAVDDSSNSVQFTIAIDNAPPEARSADLWLAVTERGLSSNVLRGENQGRDLQHAPVLRSLSHVRMPHSDSSQITARLSLDPAWKRENLRFVAFLQDHRSLRILGAAAISAPR